MSQRDWSSVLPSGELAVNSVQEVSGQFCWRLRSHMQVSNNISGSFQGLRFMSKNGRGLSGIPLLTQRRSLIIIPTISWPKHSDETQGGSVVCFSNFLYRRFLMRKCYKVKQIHRGRNNKKILVWRPADNKSASEMWPELARAPSTESQAFPM